MLLHQQPVWPWASELTSLYLSFLNYRVEMIMVLPLVFVRIHEFIHIKDWERLNKQTFPFLPINSFAHEFIHINDSGMLNKLIFSFPPVSSFTQQIFIEYLLSVIHYLVVEQKRQKLSLIWWTLLSSGRGGRGTINKINSPLRIYVLCGILIII